MSLKQLLHFDTVDGIKNYDPILKSYHCYNTNLLINKPLTNIKEISLKSLEFPIFFNNIRSSNSSNYLILSFTYGSFNNISIGCFIPELNYISISSLLLAINTSISSSLSSYAGVSIIFSVVNTYYISISTNCTNITLIKGILINNILGFNIGSYSTSIITTNNFYCLNIDNYINLYITNLNSGSDTNVNGRLLTFKIILDGVNGQILYLGESNTFTQTISIIDPFYVLSSINIMILDRFGFPINGGNSYFSFTLGVNYDKPIERLKYR